MPFLYISLSELICTFNFNFFKTSYFPLNLLSLIINRIIFCFFFRNNLASVNVLIISGINMLFLHYGDEISKRNIFISCIPEQEWALITNKILQVKLLITTYDKNE